jgi:hypothetical protein
MVVGCRGMACSLVFSHVGVTWGASEPLRALEAKAWGYIEWPVCCCELAPLQAIWTGSFIAFQIFSPCERC